MYLLCVAKWLNWGCPTHWEMSGTVNKRRRLSYNEDGSLGHNGVSSAVSEFYATHIEEMRARINQNKVNGLFTLEIVTQGLE